MLTKINHQCYEVDESGYFVEKVRNLWDAYLPVAHDFRLHLWESVAWRTRAEAIAAVQNQRRRVARDLASAIAAATAHRKHGT